MVNNLELYACNNLNKWGNQFKIINLLKIQNHAKLYMSNLSEEEKNELNKYTIVGYRKLNIKLRKNLSLTKKNCETIFTLDNCIKKFKYNKEITVYRKLLLPEITKKIIVNNWLEKGYILNRSYTSTSLNPYAFNVIFNVGIAIKIPTSIDGAYISPLSDFKYEKEYLLSRNIIYDINNYKKIINECGNEIYLFNTTAKRII